MAHIFVDADMVPIIDFLNGVGAATAFSCQGTAGQPTSSPESAYIMFGTLSSLEAGTAALAKLATTAGRDALAARILADVRQMQALGEGSEGLDLAGWAWQYRARWHHYPESIGEQAGTLRMIGSVKMRSEDIAELTSILTSRT